MSNKLGGVSENGEALSNMMEHWDTTPFEPEPDDPTKTLWYILATPTDDQGPSPIQDMQALIDGLCVNPPLAPELIVPPSVEDTYRFALRRLAAMAGNGAAVGSMRTELYWTYRMGQQAGYTTGQIKQDCAASLVQWRILRPRNSQ